MVLITLALVNLSLAGYAAVTANNTANAAACAPGGQANATVCWRVSNFFSGLLRLFGAGSGDILSGQAMAMFRKKG